MVIVRTIDQLTCCYYLRYYVISHKVFKEKNRGYLAGGKAFIATTFGVYFVVSGASKFR